ncbi:MAG: helix-turn-helix transcriptional regulator [Flavobacteriaceae bacterium]|nr:helix-turn-helix transcriptional regulator [Flavobacteriaceae bacterium]
MFKYTTILRLPLFALLLVFIVSNNNVYAFAGSLGMDAVVQDESNPSFVFMKEQDQSRFEQDSIQMFEDMAIIAARNNDVVNASIYLEKYIKYSGDNGFLDTAYFKRFDDAPEFIELQRKYSLNFGWLNFFYLFSALIGFFIGFMLLLGKKKDRTAAILISIFVLVHSVFIFHLFLFNTNLQFRAPHTLLMSSIFSYLYGPLIYFYFKRITLTYQFRKIDWLHAIPTVVIIIISIPLFILPAEEKLRMMFEVGTVDKMPYLILGFSTKLLSLLIYGYLTLRVYLKAKNYSWITEDARKWIRNLVTLTQVYVLSYFIYGFIITDLIPRSDILYHVQIIAMASMVLYIGYKSYLMPNLFTSTFAKHQDKYKKSGLTSSFSTELKEQLMQLLEVDKIYRQNNISLAIVSDRLGTTRHNTSQVINEHFGLNFFELINRYRIEEATEILKNDKNKNLNIIDVAYEVGFNNKVTFNKSFRKVLSQTPSQYLSSLNV